MIPKAWKAVRIILERILPHLQQPRYTIWSSLQAEHRFRSKLAFRRHTVADDADQRQMKALASTTQHNTTHAEAANRPVATQRKQRQIPQGANCQGRLDGQLWSTKVYYCCQCYRARSPEASRFCKPNSRGIRRMPNRAPSCHGFSSLVRTNHVILRKSCTPLADA